MKQSKYLSLACCILLLSFFLFQNFSLKEPGKELIVKVKPMFGNKTLLLEKENYLTAKGDTVSVSRLRFYISAIQLTFKDGSVYKEQNSYHLIDAEDTSTLMVRLKSIPMQEIAAMDFNIGVDSLASVSGALDGDLDPVKGMYWAWNSGYINAKLEGKNRAKHTKEKEFEFHIGGYLPPFQSIRKVHLDNMQQANPVLIADVEAWFRNISLRENSRVVMPGPAAMKVADDYTNMFRFEN